MCLVKIEIVSAGFDGAVQRCLVGRQYELSSLPVAIDTKIHEKLFFWLSENILALLYLLTYRLLAGPRYSGRTRSISNNYLVPQLPDWFHPEVS